MYLFLDCEMGGIGREYSLLTVYLIVLDSSFQKIDELSLTLKPNDGIYHVCGPAMEVNKIDLIKHDKTAITYKEGGTLLYKFLSKNSDNGKIKLIPCGHGIRGDVEVIIEHIIGRNTFETFTSYRMLDTSSVAQFLKVCGLFPEEVSGSLESMAIYFGIIKKEVGVMGGELISFSGPLHSITSLHDVKSDTLVTVEVLKALIKILNKK